MHTLYEEVASLVERASAPFKGRWKEPKQGPWVSVAINGKYPGPRGKVFGGVFPLGIESIVPLLRQGHKPWLKWARNVKFGHEPFTIAAFRHPEKGGRRDVLWYWDSSDGFRDTILSRKLLKKSQPELVREMNGDAVQHVVDMARKHGIKGEGPGGKFTPAQVRKLAAMRETLDEEVEVLTNGSHPASFV